ncbi:MAG: peptidoglycan-binding protein, partial [Verrucomicrobiota bacterium]
VRRYNGSGTAAHRYRRHVREYYQHLIAIPELVDFELSTAATEEIEAHADTSASTIAIPPRPEAPVASGGHPNGLWIWRLKKIRPDYIRALQERNVKRVYLKVFDDLNGPDFWSFQCTRQLIRKFDNAGIEVFGWGYHFDRRETVDVARSIKAVLKAVDCGLAGYVADVEVEVKKASTHGPLREILEGIKAGLDGKPLGYSSFGHPEFHLEVPWKMLDEVCDLALPQIYFEKWTFGSSDENEVQAAIKAHRELGLTNAEFLPVWGSEDDTTNPASASQLQEYLRRFPGSSIFHAPAEGGKGKAWELLYSEVTPVVGLPASSPEPFDIGRFPGVNLRNGSEGVTVERVQRRLAELGYEPGPIDGEFGPMTRNAVLRFQAMEGLTTDGIVGRLTWAALREDTEDIAEIEPTATGSANRQTLAEFARVEASKNLKWENCDSEAEKYLFPLREPMVELGHIADSRDEWYNWCAAFVTYCTRNVGYEIPDQPDGFWATMALVEAWKFWGKENDMWLNTANSTIRRGDIVCFEWFDGDTQLDHIGIAVEDQNGNNIQVAEGNKSNRSGIFDRRIRNIMGVVRLV